MVWTVSGPCGSTGIEWDSLGFRWRHVRTGPMQQVVTVNLERAGTAATAPSVPGMPGMPGGSRLLLPGSMVPLVF